MVSILILLGTDKFRSRVSVLYFTFPSAMYDSSVRPHPPQYLVLWIFLILVFPVGEWL